jgi:hypothetical protein
MAIVIVNKYEPEGAVAARLLELAVEQGGSPSDVQASRGEHDAALSFRVPDKVAEAFGEDRAERWPSKIENDAETGGEQHVAGVDGDAVAADGARAAQAAREANTTNEDAEAAPAKTKAK